MTKLSDDPADGLRWPKTELFFDSVSALPLHFILHDFDGGLFGEYAFTEFEPKDTLPDDAFEVRKLSTDTCGGALPSMLESVRRCSTASSTRTPWAMMAQSSLTRIVFLSLQRVCRSRRTARK